MDGATVLRNLQSISPRVAAVIQRVPIGHLGGLFALGYVSAMQDAHAITHADYLYCKEVVKQVAAGDVVLPSL